MFKWKVTIIDNNQKVEKEFDDANEYYSYLQSNKLSQNDIPSMGLWQWSQLHDYLENLVEKKLGNKLDDMTQQDDYEDYFDEEETSGLVDFEPYYQAIVKHKSEKQELEADLMEYRNDLEKLTDIENELIATWMSKKDTLMKNLIADVEKIENMIEETEKKLNSLYTQQ